MEGSESIDMGDETGLVFVLSMSTLPLVISNDPQIVTIALLWNEKYMSWKSFTSCKMRRDTEPNFLLVEMDTIHWNLCCVPRLCKKFFRLH